MSLRQAIVIHSAPHPPPHAPTRPHLSILDVEALGFGALSHCEPRQVQHIPMGHKILNPRWHWQEANVG